MKSEIIIKISYFNRLDFDEKPSAGDGDLWRDRQNSLKESFVPHSLTISEPVNFNDSYCLSPIANSVPNFSSFGWYVEEQP